jgi:hypothetical protein
LNKPITKEQFFKRVAEVPMVTDLLRAETFFKDRGYNSSKVQQKLELPLVVSYHGADFCLTFKFNPRPVSDYIEGQEITRNASHNYSVEMRSISLENIFADVKQRILAAVKILMS